MVCLILNIQEYIILLIKQLIFFLIILYVFWNTLDLAFKFFLKNIIIKKIFKLFALLYIYIFLKILFFYIKNIVKILCLIIFGFFCQNIEFLLKKF